MPEYRSRTTTAGRNMAGARALWRATGMKDDDFHKPIVAVANSFTQFVPGHVHLKDMGQLVARAIENGNISGIIESWPVSSFQNQPLVPLRPIVECIASCAVT